MKKICSSVIAAVILAAAPLSFAAQGGNEAVAVKGYFSSQSSSKQDHAMTAAKSRLFPSTDITVVNSANDPIYVVVPGAINDFLAPQVNDHIRNDGLYGDTHIVLQDMMHNTFFDQTVCRLSVISVYGGIGNFKVNVDSEYCH